MAKRDIDAPEKDLLTEREALAWLEGRGLDVPRETFRAWVAAGLVFGRRELSRQNVLYPWQGLVSLLWRVQLGGLAEDAPSE